MLEGMAMLNSGTVLVAIVVGDGGVEVDRSWLGELVLSRFADEGSSLGERERFLGDFESLGVGPCLVLVGDSRVVRVPLEVSLSIRSSSFMSVCCSFSDGGNGSGNSLVGVGKS